MCLRVSASCAMALILVCLSGARSLVRPGALRFGPLRLAIHERPMSFRRTPGRWHRTRNLRLFPLFFPLLIHCRPIVLAPMAFFSQLQGVPLRIRRNSHCRSPVFFLRNFFEHRLRSQPVLPAWSEAECGESLSRDYGAPRLHRGYEVTPKSSGCRTPSAAAPGAGACGTTGRPARSCARSAARGAGSPSSA